MKTSHGCESIEFSSLLGQNFEAKVNKARLNLISMIVLALCRAKTVNYMSLVCAFDNTASPGSSMRRLQRFMAGFDLPMKLVSRFIFGILPEKESLILVMDRTNWKFGSSNINILMLGVCYKNTSIQLIFNMLYKRGSSERIDLVSKFIEWFGKDKIDCLLADREFIGYKWLNFLNENNIKYYIRTRKNIKFFCFRKNEKRSVFMLFNNLRKGELYHHPNIVKINETKCYVSGLKIVDENGKDDLLTVISFEKPNESLFYY